MVCLLDVRQFIGDWVVLLLWEESLEANFWKSKLNQMLGTLK